MEVHFINGHPVVRGIAIVQLSVMAILNII